VLCLVEGGARYEVDVRERSTLERAFVPFVAQIKVYRESKGWAWALMSFRGLGQCHQGIWRSSTGYRPYNEVYDVRGLEVCLAG
jgi:hypothetical protein